MKRIGKLLILALAAILAAAAVFFGYYLLSTRNAKLDAEKLSLSFASVRIFDAEGALCEVRAAGSARENVPFEALPEHVPQAFVAVEDKRFYSHHGLDYKRMIKAAAKNLLSFSFREGASTISQQLIKNTHLSGEKTIGRKLTEIRLTKQLEKRYSKRQILELYLNSIYFGHSSFGISSAARFYFGKGADELSPAESALLAALVRSPNRYSPFRDPAACKTRRDQVLSLMQEQGFLTAEEAREAKEAPLPAAPCEEGGANAYVSLVMEELSAIFPDAGSSALRGLSVYTALDPALQAALDGQETPCGRALFVRENASGRIRAFSSTAGMPLRQPASLIKPLAVYAPAVEEGLLSPATPILDEKVDFGGYSPENYGGTYGGYMSAREALARSVNVPAVKVLNTLGCEKSALYLEKMGLAVPESDKTLALALGGTAQGYTIRQLSDAYAALCDGTYSPSHAVVRIETEAGKTIYEEAPPRRVRVFSEETCALVGDMLESAVQEGTAKKLRVLPYAVRAKTGTGGTKQGNRDAYTVAYTAEHTVGVWLGNADNTPVEATGGGLPASLALSALRALYARRDPAPFAPCETVVRTALDREAYEREHAVVRADPASPPQEIFYELFASGALPAGESSRFSRPTIRAPQIFVRNHAVCIELCQTEYYDYVIKRLHDGKETTIYCGPYTHTVTDNAVRAGETYVYTVQPRYLGHAGEIYRLPSVCLPGADDTPDGWWE